MRFEPASGPLRRGRDVVTLRPKSAAVLALLVAHAGEVVSKRELLDQVWPDGYVGDAVLSVCVNELRQALGDDARRPRFVATAHRRGYQLVAEVSSTPLELEPPPPLFVGRAPALATLGAWWEQAQRGQRAIGFVAAPGGVGKTALLDAFVHGVRAHPRPPLVARGDCVEQYGYGPGEPYLPVLAALTDLCHGPGGGAVREVLRGCAPTWLAQRPELYGDAEPAPPEPRAAARPTERMLRELAVALETLTACRRMVLVLEDLHAGDRSTTELLSYLARRREPARLLLLASYRPAEVIARGHPLHGVVQDLRAHRLCGPRSAVRGTSCCPVPPAAPGRPAAAGASARS